MAEKKYPELIVGALIFDKDGKVFLIKSPEWVNKYVIPGGHVEVGETLEEAVKREVKEETGLDVFDIEFIRFGQFIFEKEYLKKRHFVGVQFACRTDSTEVRLNSEASSYLWAPIGEALKLPLTKYVRDNIDEYLKKKLKKNKD